MEAHRHTRGIGVSEDQPLDLVVLAASGGWGVPDQLAPAVSESLGSQDVAASTAHIAAWPTEILGGTDGIWADDVAQAEIILFSFPQRATNRAAT